MAAGKGKRMYSKTPKILHKILGKEIILFAVDLAQEIGSEQIIVVADKNIDRIRKTIGTGVKYVMQPDPLGTGDAALKGILKANSKKVLIMNGDVPMLDPDTIRTMIAYHLKNKSALTFLSCKIKDPSGYGKVLRDRAGKVRGIIEHADANAQQLKIDEINAGVYFGDHAAVLRALQIVNQQNRQGEVYLTDSVRIPAGATGTVLHPVYVQYREL